MKIGIICHDAFPIVQPYQGGLEMITALLVNELINRGHEVTSLCVKGSQLPGSMLYYDDKKEVNPQLSKELIEFSSVSKALNLFFQGDFDIIQNHSFHYQSIILGNLSPIPFITTFHTPIFPYLKVGIDAISSRHNQLFTGVSKSLCELYERHLPTVTPIYNGIELSKWKTEYINVQDYYSWSGRICKEKGLDRILELCKTAGVKLKIAGPISDHTYFKERIEPHLDKVNFEYVGHLKQSALNTHIKNSKGFLFSSLWEEPYGLVIAEALACGVPVLANAVGAASEIINDNSGCLYSIDHPATFIQGLQSIERLDRRDCRARAEVFCNHYTMVDAYEELYEMAQANHLIQNIL
ncbi:glycosyltransferase [Aquimarina sp. W85]|uniref:glycosyltransferase n=1 Tax=Aquimarina rhodophyticola TaxID=3342246 RepID=UPI0036733A98